MAGYAQYALKHIDHALSAKRQVSNPFRMSSSGMCVRKLYYRLNPEQHAQAALSTRAKLIFKFGHMIDDMMKELYVYAFSNIKGYKFYPEDEMGTLYMHVPVPKEALVDFHKRNQHLVLEYEDVGGGEVLVKIPGHTDGLLETPDGPIVIDFKSMSNYAFRKLRRRIVGVQYKTQLSCYKNAIEEDGNLDIMATSITGIRKETCHLAECTETVNKAHPEAYYVLDDEKITKDIDDNEEPPEKDTLLYGVLNGPDEKHIDDYYNDAVARFQQLIINPNAPEREHKAVDACARCEGLGWYETAKLKKRKECPKCDGTGKVRPQLTFPCSYCDFKHTCYKNGLSKELVSGRPVFYVNKEN